jgi:hypothetical protein
MGLFDNADLGLIRGPEAGKSRFRGGGLSSGAQRVLSGIGKAGGGKNKGKPGFLTRLLGATGTGMAKAATSRFSKPSTSLNFRPDKFDDGSDIPKASWKPGQFGLSNIPGVKTDDDDDDNERPWWKDVLSKPRDSGSGWDPSDLSLLLASGGLSMLGGDDGGGEQHLKSYEGGDPNWDPSRLGQVAAAEQMRNTQDIDAILKRGTRIGGQVSSQGLRFQRAPGLGGGSMPLFQMGPMGRDVANYAPDRGAVDPAYLTGTPLRPQGSVSPSLLPEGGGVPQQARAGSTEFTGGEGGGDPVESLLQTYSENAQQGQPGARQRKPQTGMG